MYRNDPKNRPPWVVSQLIYRCFLHHYLPPQSLIPPRYVVESPMNVQKIPGSYSMMQRKPLRQLDHFLNDAIRYVVKRGETLTKSVSVE